MREHKVDVFLFKNVERRSFYQFTSDFFVSPFDVRFLLRVVRVAEENMRTPRKFRRIVFWVNAIEFDHLRIAEFAAIVRENDGKKDFEEFRSCGIMQHDKDTRTRL